MLLASTQVNVSLMSRSTLRSFHLRWPRLRLMLAMHFSRCTFYSMWIGTPRYLTWVSHGMPAISVMLSSVSTWDLDLFSFRFHTPLRLSSSWIA